MAGTGAGLVHFFPSIDRFDTVVPASGQPEGMPGRVVTSVLRRADGRLWVGFAQEWNPKLRHPRRDKDGAFTSAGLALYDPASGAWSYQVHASISGEPASIKTVPSENITDLAFDTGGNLWVGTKRYDVWQHFCPEGGADCVDAWVPAGGGVAVTDIDKVATAGGAVDTAKWITYRQETNSSGAANAQTTCYSDSISMLRPDVDGRMWVATLDRGLLLFRKGLVREGCSGLPRYTEVSKGGTFKVEGLRGKHVFSVDVDDRGCLWIGHGSGRDVGQGVAVLCHNNTFDDSSISETPWISDDQWQFFTFAGQIEGDTNALISAIVVEPGSDRAVLGTRDDRGGDGFGIAEFTLSSSTWAPHKTASNGLPSNHITDVRRDPTSGDVWFSLRNRGVARRKADGSWQWWRAFGPGREVTQVKTETKATSRLVNVPVKLADKAAFDAIFTGSNRFVVIGDDPTRYRVMSFKAAGGGLGPWITIQPNLQKDVPADTPVYLIDRGPASNEATRIAFGKDGTAYVGGRESIWMSPNECSNPPECWLDGGLGVYDGKEWLVYGQPAGAIDSTGLVDQMVNSLAVDLTGKVWVGTGDQDSTQGDGISILDPATGKFTHHYIPPTGGSGVKLGSNGIGDLSVDVNNDHMWVAHFPTKKNNSLPDGTVSQVMFGGGASMWDGKDWTAWKKDKGALLKGFGLGTFNSILADRVHNLAWLGGWDAVPRQFHWTEGRGVNAALNWCSLDDCRNEGWQSRTWDNEGEVNALALDKNGNVWVSMNRRNLGLIPPFGGVRVFDGVNWFAYNPSNTPMSSLNITSLSAFDDGVFMGTFDAGVTVYSFTIPPTATPAPTFTPSATASSTRVATIEVTPTQDTGTRPPTATRTPSPSATRPGTTPGTPGTPGAPGGCRPGAFGGWCYIHLPYMYRYCRGANCPKRTTPQPTITRGTPVPSATRPAATAVPSATPPAPSPTATPSAGTSAPPTGSPSATGTGAAPSPGPSSSATTAPTTAASATATATSRPSPSATATAPAFPAGEWQNANRSGQVTRATLNDVHGVTNRQVVMVGANSTLLIWDGVDFTSGTVPVGRTLNGVMMLDERTGYVVGDFVGQSSTLIQTRNGGQSWQIGTTVNLDNWAAVAVFKGPQGIRGWIVGKTSGSRQYYDGTQWAKQSSSDLNNTSHKYADVAMISESSAVAVQNGGTGSRIYTWDGTAWSPGAQTGALNALDVPPSGHGVVAGLLGASGAAGAGRRVVQDGQCRLRAAERCWRTKMLAPGSHLGRRRARRIYLDGAGWQTISVTGITKDLNSVWFTRDGRDGWAVGVDARRLLSYRRLRRR
ncbi:MAG: two-component regulator propeller domain-containing protein [Anaerolineae bacterium]